MKDSISAPILGWKFFNSLRDENDEPIYTYNDEYMRHFVRRSIKRSQVCAFNQYYQSKNCVDVLKIISEKINVKGNIYDNIEAYMRQKNILLKFIKEENESKFDEYRKTDEEQMENYIKKELRELPIHHSLKQLSLNEILWDFNAVSLYPSATSDEKSICFKPAIDNDIIEKFNNQNFAR